MGVWVFTEPQKAQKFDHAEVIYYFFEDKKRDNVLIFTLRRFIVPSAFVTFVVDLGYWVFECLSFWVFESLSILVFIESQKSQKFDDAEVIY